MSTMRKLNLFTFFFAILMNITAFSQSTDSVIIQNAYGTDSKEVMDITQFLQIDIFKINVIFPGIINRKVSISYAEYRKGKVTRKDKLFDDKKVSAYYLTPRQDDSTFSFKVFSQSKNADSTDIMFIYPAISKTLTFKTERTKDYSMRDAILSRGKKQTKIGKNQRFPLLIYSLPYVDAANPERKSYCDLTKEGVAPEMWWDKYKVRHYIIFYLEFTE